MKKFVLGTLATAYAVTVGVLMKKRKDEGKSLLAKDPKDSTFGNVVDEFVELHKEAYENVKNFLVPLFDDIGDVDTLKDRLGLMVDDFSVQTRKLAQSTKGVGTDKINAAKAGIEEAYSKAEKALKSAQKKAESFGEDASKTLKGFFEEKKNMLETAYKDTKDTLEKSLKK